MAKTIRLAAPLQTDSIVDGEGIRTVIWTQGCSHNCLGCHNPETHDFNGGYLVDIDEVKKENRQLKRQLDQLTYLALANFHAANNPNWQAEELESVESSYDLEQKQLLDRIAELIKEDKDRGQTQKHSHKSN